MLETKTVTNGPIAKQLQRACDDTLPWLIFFSLGPVRVMKARWRNTETQETGFGSRDYECAFCGRHVSASEGYWLVGENDGLESTIAICPKCNGPTYFQRHTIQMPAPPFGESVSHIDNAKIAAIYEEARQC